MERKKIWEELFDKLFGVMEAFSTHELLFADIE